MRTVMPQITKSAETASRMLATMREPVERVAPALTQLADTLNNPLMTDLPRRMTETMDVLSSIPRALGPLGQVADLAGGFFGSRGLGAFGGTGRPSPSASRTSRGARRRRGRRRRGGRASRRHDHDGRGPRRARRTPSAARPPSTRPRRSRRPPSGRRRRRPRSAPPRRPRPRRRRPSAPRPRRRRPEGTGHAVHGQEGRAPEDGGRSGRRPRRPPPDRAGQPAVAEPDRRGDAPVATRDSPCIVWRVGSASRPSSLAQAVSTSVMAKPRSSNGASAPCGPWHLDHEAGGAPFEEVGDDGQHDGRRHRPRRRRSSPAPRWCRGGRGAAGCRRRPAPCPAARPSRSMASGRAPSARWYGTSPGSGQSYSSRASSRTSSAGHGPSRTCPAVADR